MVTSGMSGRSHYEICCPDVESLSVVLDFTATNVPSPQSRPGFCCAGPPTWHQIFGLLFSSVMVMLHCWLFWYQSCHCIKARTCGIEVPLQSSVLMTSGENQPLISLHLGQGPACSSSNPKALVAPVQVGKASPEAQGQASAENCRCGPPEGTGRGTPGDVGISGSVHNTPNFFHKPN